MRTVIRRRLAVVAGAMAGLALASLLLTGCVSAPAPRPTSTPHATPLFATDDAALAAATKAYAAYLAMSDTIAHDGGTDPERIKDFVTSKQYVSQTKDIEAFRSKGYIARGTTTFDSMRIQQVMSSSIGGEVYLYVCIDVSGVKLVDSNGVDVTPADRPNRLPLEVQFVLENPGGTKLMVNKSSVWPGKNFC